ncbi:hypothetical protein HGM15179_015781 [Zosterops borbonicus]|uniref:Uncharacterized protein n=1 Tax=Zosterops borbonicus TaxID=364589 RepID=A0A8K1LEV0_9PASS|nr:hypothetical protein HGM15179_015781 [Zosterops borbonicus]
MSLQPEKRKVRRNSYADPQVSAEGGEGGVTGGGAEIPLQLMVKTMEKQLCLCSPWRTAGIEINLKLMEERFMPEQIDTQKEAVNPLETCAGAGEAVEELTLQPTLEQIWSSHPGVGFVTLWEPTLEQAVPE